MSVGIDAYENKKTEFGRLIKIVGEELKRISEDKDLGNHYINICVLALEILENVLGEQYSFPIDVSNIVESLGINVFYQPLNRMNQDFRVHKMVGKLVKKVNIFTGEQIDAILVDRESNIEEQRYAIAHELAHYLIHHDNKIFDSEYHIMPMLFKRMEEMVADIFAIFLLIPIPIFLEEFTLYIREKKVPVQTSKWLEYLGRVTAVPYEDVAIGYQNIRYVCGFIYEMKHDPVHKPFPKSNNDRLNDILNKQVNKIMNYMTEEVEQILFC